MRFGLGPSLTTSETIYKRIWSEPGLAYKLCLDELNYGAAITDQRLRANLLSTREAAPLNSGKPPGFYNGEQERRVLLQQRMKPTIGFVERLVLFWANHFNVYGFSGIFAINNTGAFEREAIRPNILGRFEDLLVAVAQSGLMLSYLDGRNSSKNKPNQNFAREILELHTIGSSSDYWSRDVERKSNYSQNDVEALTYILTGWGVKCNDGDNKFLVDSSLLIPPGAEKMSFTFNPSNHDTRDRILLGKVFAYSSGSSGVERGIQALKMLARQPETGKRIAYKLLRHFVTDEPREATVDALARIFNDSGGDLLKTSQALLALDEAWTTPLNRLRQPYPWFVSSLRGMGIPLSGLMNLTSEGTAAGNVSFHQHLEGALSAIGQRPWGWPTPDGYPDRNSFWLNGNSLRVRTGALYDLLTKLSGSKYPTGIGKELVIYDPAIPNSENCKITPSVTIKSIQSRNAVQWTIPDATSLAIRLFPAGLSQTTRLALAELTSQNDTLGALALLFSSPEYVQG